MELEIMMLYSSETLPLSCIESRLKCIYAHMHNAHYKSIKSKHVHMHAVEVLNVHMHVCTNVYMHTCMP